MTAHIINKIDAPQEQKAPESGIFADEFLEPNDLVSVKKEAAERTRKRALAEIDEMVRNKSWRDIIALFYPIEEKQPELVAHGLENDVLSQVAFALGQLSRYDEAIDVLTQCLKTAPDDFMLHNSLAYTAYDSLYAAKNREIFLSGKARSERIALAHHHFAAAKSLRPEGVTNFYREGMLFKQIEKKTALALPLFTTAVKNWETLDEEQKRLRHQERKNYIKALYQLSSALLERGKAAEALSFLKRCISEDENRGHVGMEFKYFALGKIHFNLNHFAEARDALLFALQCGRGRPADFVCELLGRTCLSMDKAEKALHYLERIPEKQRRPYFRWTEADVLCALNRYDKAVHVLTECAKKDRRSQHKALIRLAKISYLRRDYRSALGHAAAADRFYRGKWSNPFADGLFWQALSAFRLGENDKAAALVAELSSFQPAYPKLDLLKAKLKAASGDIPVSGQDENRK
jgi:tetratricopeptide (TPR) repeat protein